MATTLELNQLLVEQSGVSDLVTDRAGADFTSNTGIKSNALYYLNAGLRWLNQRYTHEATRRRTTVSLEEDGYSVQVDNVRNITRMDTLDENGKRLRIAYRSSEWLRDEYGEDFADADAGKPLYWTWNDVGVEATDSTGIPTGIETNEGTTTITFTVDEVLYASCRIGSEIYFAIEDTSDSSYKVKVYSTAGVLARTISLTALASDLSTDGTNLFVAISGVGVQVRTTAGTLIGTICTDHTDILRIAIADGYLYGLRSDDALLYKYSTAGDFQTSVAITIDASATNGDVAVFGDYVYVVVGEVDVDVLLAADLSSVRTIDTGSFQPNWCAAYNNLVYLNGPTKTVAYDVEGNSLRTLLDTTTGGTQQDSVISADDGNLLNFKDTAHTFNRWTVPSLPSISSSSEGNILILPPADRDYTLEIFGKFNTSVLSADTDTNWWTANYPELVVRSARLQLELDGHRNVSGLQAFQGQLEGEIAMLVANDRFAFIAGYTPQEAVVNG